MKITLVPRITRDRFDRGDWQTARNVLVQCGTKELLWWQSGKYWGDRIDGYKSFSASCIFEDRSIMETSWKTVFQGGRASKAVFLRHADQINALFGMRLAHLINPRKTLVIESNAPHFHP